MQEEAPVNVHNFQINTIVTGGCGSSVGDEMRWLGNTQMDIWRHVLLMTIKTITNNYDNYAKWFYHYTAEGKDYLRQKSPAKN